MFKKLTISLTLLLTPVAVVLAQSEWVNNSLNEVDSGLGGADMKQIINNIINIFLGFLGLVAVALILYGGFLWMTSQGNVDRIKKAKDTIIGALIGLIIIMASYAIVSFVMRTMADVTGLTNETIVDPGDPVDPGDDPDGPG